jgi:hypothetical protein
MFITKNSLKNMGPKRYTLGVLVSLWPKKGGTLCH